MFHVRKLFLIGSAATGTVLIGFCGVVHAKERKNTTLPKVFNDPVHGHIELPTLCHKIVDTPQFQRLRHLKQLGGVYQVYPGASHNRFEHSIGVCHLAGQFLKEIKSRQKELFEDNHDGKGYISEEHILCVQIAGLCHDLGHGPLSHGFDNKFIPNQKRKEQRKKEGKDEEKGTCTRFKPVIKSANEDNDGKRWKHEDGSEMMFDSIVDFAVVASQSVEENHRGFDNKDVIFLKKHKEFIKALIKGEVDAEHTRKCPKERFLYEIVANKKNEIDVDKFDYFARDCHHLGMRSNFDHNRYMKFARVLQTSNGEFHICVRDKEAADLYDLFSTRYILHRRAYQHKVARVVEYMFMEALQLVNDVILFNGKTISGSIDDPVAYTQLDDTVFRRIQTLELNRDHSNETSMNVNKAKDILKKIESRELYPFIGMAYATYKLEKDDTIRDEIHCFSKGKLKPKDIVVMTGSFDYGMKEKDPLDACFFYTKENPDKAITYIALNMPRMNKPTQFQEFFVHVYCKKNTKEDRDIAKASFDEYCKAKNLRKQEYCNIQSHQKVEPQPPTCDD